MTYPSAGIAVSTGRVWQTSLAAPTSVLVGISDTQTLTNKTVDGVSPATLAFVDVTSSIQTQLNGKQALGSYAPVFALTTTGTSGAATYASNVLNIPQYTSGGGSWPAGGSGIPNYNGSSAWGTSYNASSLIPANFIATLNQNTSGTAANVTGVVAAANGGRGSSVVPSAGQIDIGNAGGTAFTPVTLSNDCTLTSAGAITCTKSNGTAFGTGAFAAIANYAPLASPAFTGTVTAPTFSGALTGHATLDALAFTLTTTGTSGAATYSSNILNIPQYAGGGSMTWPSTAGIAYWTSGTAWGGAYNSSTPIPANYLPAALSSSTSVNGTTIPASSTLFTTASIYAGTLTSSQVTTALTFTPVAPTVTSLASLTTAAGGALGTGAYATISNYLTTASAASSYAPLASPTFTGTVTVPSGAALGTPASGVITNFTGTCTSCNVGGTAANLSGTAALPNGTTATTQTAGDNSTNLATTAYVTTAVTNGAYTLPAQYKKWSCEPGMGDGLNAMAAGTYLQTECLNTSGVTWTITSIKCFSDNAGSSTLNATDGSSNALLTGAVTCSSSFAAGTQGSTTTIANGGYVKFTFVADGTSKQATFVVSGTY